MIILASLLFLAAAPADVVVDAGPTASFTVADLDLTSASGMHLYNRRLAGALEDVCGSFANAVEWSDKDRVGQCRDRAMASASRQLASKATSIRLAIR